MASKKVAKKAPKKTTPVIPGDTGTKKEKRTTGLPTAASVTVVSNSAGVTLPRELPAKDREMKLGALKNELGDLLVSADQASTPYMVRRPTGIMELDIALGGGFPAGGPCVVGGPFNSGKTWLMWRTLAMQQAIYGSNFVGAIANTETPLDYWQARKAGAVISMPDEVLNQQAEYRRQRGTPDFTSEEIYNLKYQIGHIELIHGRTGEEILTGILKFNESRVCSFIAIDSINGLQPEVDSGKDLDEADKMAAQAMMMKRFWMHYVPQVRGGRNYTTLYLTQQAVSNTDKANAPSYVKKYLRDWELKGGESTKHHSLVTLYLWSGEKIKLPNYQDAVGKYVNYLTKKGKAGTHDNLTGEFPFYYHIGGVDIHGELIASAVRRNVLVYHNNRIQLVNGTNREPIEGWWVPNEQALRDVLMHDFDFELAIRREVLASAGVECLYR